jgi:hypothetical protein
MLENSLLFGDWKTKAGGFIPVSWVGASPKWVIQDAVTVLLESARNATFALHSRL